MGEGADPMLRLGVQAAEIDALLARALTATTPGAERRALDDLARSARLMAFYARSAARGRDVWTEPVPIAPGAPERVRRRAVSARRRADLIINWTRRGDEPSPGR